MGKLLVTIGGSGSACGTAILHGLSANLTELQGTMDVLYLDKDATNGTTSDFRKKLQLYGRMTEELAPAEGRDGRQFARIDINDNYDDWTIEGILGNDAEEPLENYCATASQSFLPLFYTDTERRMKLSVGFERHPNIGSLVFDGIKENDKFREKIMHVIKSGGRTQIFITGSIFGGTGASMFANLAEYIRSLVKDESPELQNKLYIGGVLLTPYFSIPLAPAEELNNNPVKDDNITEATQTALGYYASIENLVCGGGKERTHGKAIFDALYLLGFSPKTQINNDGSPAPYCKGGSSQLRDACIVELLSACAAAHFFNATQDGRDDLKVNQSDVKENIFRLSLGGTEGALPAVTWDNIPRESAMKLQQMLRFALLLCCVLQPDWQAATSKRNALYARWLKKGAKVKPVQLQAARDYLFEYLRFIYQVACTNAGGERICAHLANPEKLWDAIELSVKPSLKNCANTFKLLADIVPVNDLTNLRPIIDALNGKYWLAKAKDETALLNSLYAACTIEEKGDE